MCQLPPDSHSATASQMEAALADPAVVMPPAMVAAPAIPTPATRCLTEIFRAAACLAWYCMGDSFLTAPAGLAVGLGRQVPRRRCGFTPRPDLVVCGHDTSTHKTRTGHT